MTKTQSPAPYGSPGLAFSAYGGDSGYTAASPHRGQDHEWFKNNVDQSRQTFAPIGGVITAAFNDGGNHDNWGNYIDITVDTTDGSRSWARLAHHATGTVQVKVGQRVAAGQRIGTMGNTGKAYGIHLHEEFWLRGVRVDPIQFRTRDIPGTPVTSSGNPAQVGQAGPTTPTIHYLEDDMASNPIEFVKGDKSPEVYAIFFTAGAANEAAKNQGGVYFARNYVTQAQLNSAERNGYRVNTIPQAELDAIPKVFGSR